MNVSKSFKVAICVSIFALILCQYPSMTAFAKPFGASWVFMLYLDADNNLDMFGPLNIEQIKQGLSPTANIKVVVLMDRLNLPAHVYEVTHEEIKTVESLGEVDMGSSETLEWFATYVMQNYPAEHYFLDLWDHGGGYRGVCWDESSGNHLSPHDVETALANTEDTVGRRIEIVGFDACLMGMIEVCYELKDVTDMVIGSEILTPGWGWPYTQLMAYLSAYPNVEPRLLSEELVEEYVDFYESVKTTLFVQLSAIDESCIPALASDLDSLVCYLQENIHQYEGVIAGARGASQQKFILGTAGVYFYIDLYKFAMLIGKRSQDATTEAMAADLMQNLDEAVFAGDPTQKHGNLDKKDFGLTVNFPPNTQTYSSTYETYLPCFVTETEWLSFLMAYYDAM